MTWVFFPFLAWCQPAPEAEGAVPSSPPTSSWPSEGGVVGGVLGGPVSGDPVERGEIWAGMGGCVACHTAEEGPMLGGGYALRTEFGTFYGSNLTPDRETGLGDWTIEEFARALRTGHRPGGGAYWPAFPYPSFRRLPNDVVEDLWAWLRTVPPVVKPEIAHQTGRYGPFDRWLWRTFVWRPAKAGPPPNDPLLARGEVLVDGLGHCGECHTPRTRYGRLDEDHPLAGNPAPLEPAPSLVGQDGPGAWTSGDWDTFLTLGMTPDGDFPGGEMARIVHEGTARLTSSDRAAMIAWLRARADAAQAAVDAAP